LAATLWHAWPCRIGASVFCLAALAAGQDATEDKCVLEGTVRNSVTRTAVGKASIHLIPVDGSAGYKGTTNAAGTFHFVGIESGTYRIQTQRAGYQDSQFVTIQSGSAGATLHFSAGQKSSGAEILLTPYGGIRGKITGPDGEPLRGVRVSAIKRTWQRGKRLYLAFSSVDTDGAGTYDFEDITPGRYYILLHLCPGAFSRSPRRSHCGGAREARNAARWRLPPGRGGVGGRGSCGGASRNGNSRNRLANAPRARIPCAWKDGGARESRGASHQTSERSSL